MKASSSSGGKPHSLEALYLTVYVAIILHFLFLFVFPKLSDSILFTRNWGYHFISYYPRPVIVFFYLAIALIGCPPLARSAILFWEDKIWPRVGKIGRIGKYPLYVSISLLSVPVFYLLRAKYGLLGDNFLRVQQIELGHILKNEWGTMHFYGFVYTLLSGLSDWSALDAVVVMNCALGSVYIFMAFLVAEALGKNTLEKAVFWLGFILTPITQYFFGYIEIYSPAAVLLSAFLWLAIKSSQNKLNILLPFLALFAGTVSHLMTVVFFPALFYLFYRKILCRWSIFRNRKFILLEALLSIPLIILLQKMFIRGHLLIFFPNKTYSYAMFTWEHVWEFLNGQLMAAPVAFALMVFLLATYVKRRKNIDLTGQFLGITGFFAVLNSFSLNAVLGAADWDLLCVSGLPVTVFALYLLFNAFEIPLIRIGIKYILAIFIVFSFLHIASWIVLNATDISIQRKIDIVQNDPAEYYANNGHPPAMVLAFDFNANELEERAELWYREALRRHPRDPRHYYNLASFLDGREKNEEAVMHSSLSSHPSRFSLSWGWSSSSDSDLSALLAVCTPSRG